jgi:hypothetical protein
MAFMAAFGGFSTGLRAASQPAAGCCALFLPADTALGHLKSEEKAHA